MIIPIDDTGRRILFDKKEIEDTLKEKLHMEYHFYIGNAEERERSTHYVSDDELAKIDMPIEITEGV